MQKMITNPAPHSPKKLQRVAKQVLEMVETIHKKDIFSSIFFFKFGTEWHDLQKNWRLWRSSRRVLRFVCGSTVTHHDRFRKIMKRRWYFETSMTRSWYQKFQQQMQGQYEKLSKERSRTQREHGILKIPLLKCRISALILTPLRPSVLGKSSAQRYSSQKKAIGKRDREIQILKNRNEQERSKTETIRDKIRFSNKSTSDDQCQFVNLIYS